MGPDAANSNLWQSSNLKMGAEINKVRQNIEMARFQSLNMIEYKQTGVAGCLACFYNRNWSLEQTYLICPLKC